MSEKSLWLFIFILLYAAYCFFWGVRGSKYNSDNPERCTGYRPGPVQGGIPGYLGSTVAEPASPSPGSGASRLHDPGKARPGLGSGPDPGHRPDTKPPSRGEGSHPTGRPGGTAARIGGSSADHRHDACTTDNTGDPSGRGVRGPNHRPVSATRIQSTVGLRPEIL